MMVMRSGDRDCCLTHAKLELDVNRRSYQEIWRRLGRIYCKIRKFIKGKRVIKYVFNETKRQKLETELGLSRIPCVLLDVLEGPKTYPPEPYHSELICVLRKAVLSLKDIFSKKGIDELDVLIKSLRLARGFSNDIVKTLYQPSNMIANDMRDFCYAAPFVFYRISERDEFFKRSTDFSKRGAKRDTLEQFWCHDAPMTLSLNMILAPFSFIYLMMKKKKITKRNWKGLCYNREKLSTIFFLIWLSRNLQFMVMFIIPSNYYWVLFGR